MFKSIGKQVVILKNPKSKIFEEAIFVIKDGVTHPQSDLLKECERIINEQNFRFDKRNSNKKTAILASVISAVAVILLISILYFNLL